MDSRHCAFCKGTTGITAYNNLSLNMVGGDGSSYAHRKCFSVAADMQQADSADRYCPNCGEPLDLDHTGCLGVVRDDRNGGWKVSPSNYCGAVSDGKFPFGCTRRRGHKGDHIARGSTFTKILARWS